MFLFEPFVYPFMQQALLVGAVIAVLCAVLSCLLILRGWSLMGDAISHAVLPGIVLAYRMGLPLALGAFLSGWCCAVATGYLRQHSRLKEDTVMGVIFTGLFAVGLVLFSQTPSDLHLDHILFGNILGIPPSQVRETCAIGLGLMLLLLARRRDFLLVAFDPYHAQALGLSVQWLNYLLLALLSLAIVVSLQAVGILLVIAMLITPGATAFLLTDRYDRMLQLATASSLIATLSGIIISYHLDASPSACIVLMQATQFFLAWLFAPKNGMVAQWRRRSSFATRGASSQVTPAPESDRPR